MKIVNLTPHALNFVSDTFLSVATIPPSGVVARCATTRQKVGEVKILVGTFADENGFDRDEVAFIPVYRTAFGAVEGLPEPQEDTIYIVSSLVAQAVPERRDIFAPDDLVRDDQGRIVGAKALATASNNKEDRTV